MDARETLEYAALLAEQQDPGGTLPNTLRQIADSYDDLLAACEKLVEAHANDDEADLDKIFEAEIMAEAAIAAARGKSR